MIIRTKPARKDGRIPTTITFPDNGYGGVTITKLFTPEQVEEWKKKAKVTP